MPLVQAPRSNHGDPHEVGLLQDGPQRVDRSLQKQIQQAVNINVPGGTEGSQYST